MNKAIEQANKAILCKEVPIGAVLVDNISHKIINASHNMVNLNNNASSHAEICLINEACKIKKMKHEIKTLKIKTNGQGLYEFTQQIIKWLNKKNIKILLISIFLNFIV